MACSSVENVKMFQNITLHCTIKKPLEQVFLPSCMLVVKIYRASVGSWQLESGSKHHLFCDEPKNLATKENKQLNLNYCCFSVSHAFGFGLLDAYAMVNLGRNWSSVPKQYKYVKPVLPDQDLLKSVPVNATFLIPVEVCCVLLNYFCSLLSNYHRSHDILLYSLFVLCCVFHFKLRSSISGPNLLQSFKIL